MGQTTIVHIRLSNGRAAEDYGGRNSYTSDLAQKRDPDQKHITRMITSITMMD